MHFDVVDLDPVDIDDTTANADPAFQLVRHSGVGKSKPPTDAGIVAQDWSARAAFKRA